MPNEPITNSGKQINSAQQKQSASIAPRLLYALAIAGLVVLACLPLTLALVSYFRINTHSVRTIFFVNSLINLLIFIAIVIQAGIYWKQRALMEQQSKAMQDGLTETRNLVAQNERVVQAAETTAALTEKSFHMNSRAYVFIGTAGLEFPISSGQYPLP